MAESIQFKWPLRTWKKEEEKKNVRSKLQTDRTRLARRHLSIFPSTFQLQQERLDSSRRAGKGHPRDAVDAKRALRWKWWRVHWKWLVQVGDLSCICSARATEMSTVWQGCSLLCPDFLPSE